MYLEKFVESGIPNGLTVQQQSRLAKISDAGRVEAIRKLRVILFNSCLGGSDFDKQRPQQFNVLEYSYY